MDGEITTGSITHTHTYTYIHWQTNTFSSQTSPIFYVYQVTEEEKTTLLGLVEKAEAWIADKEALQSAKAAHEEPVYTSHDVPVQLRSIGQVGYFIIPSM